MLPHTGDEQQQQEFPAKIDFPLVKIKFSDMLSRFNKEAQINRKVGKNTFRVKFSGHGTSRALLYCIKCLLILEHRDLQEGKKFEIFIFKIAKAFNIAAVIKSKIMQLSKMLAIIRSLMSFLFWVNFPGSAFQFLNPTPSLLPGCTISFE